MENGRLVLDDFIILCCVARAVCPKRETASEPGPTWQNKLNMKALCFSGVCVWRSILMQDMECHGARLFLLREDHRVSPYPPSTS